MKKVLLSGLLPFLLCASGFAQDHPVTGVVQDEKGAPVPAASIEVSPEDTGTFTDSLGGFRISAKPNSVLVVSAAGFQEESIPIKEKSSLLIILRPKGKSLKELTVKASSQKNDLPSQAVNSQLVSGELFGLATAMGARTSFAGIGAFSTKEETKGSRYLFTGNWARGKVLTRAGGLTDNPALSFNYDKMNHNLFITQDKHKVLEIDKEQIRAFDLTIDDKEYHFKRMSVIDSNQFVQVVVETPGKYSLYKLTKTRFVKSNYHSDGMVESGVPYDEYKDEYFYFLVMPDGQSYKLITELRMKPLKEMAKADIPRAMPFISQHKYDPVDEAFLVSLVESINQ